MTQPIRTNDRANSSYYDPNDQMSRAPGASDGAGGASGASGAGGAQGAGNADKAPGTGGPGLPCFFEAQSAARDCGAAILTKNFYAGFFCGQSVAALAECLWNPSKS
jgi:hypothetical protein